MGQAVRPGELNLATPVHRHHAGETVLAGDGVDRPGQGVLGVHRRSVLPPDQALDRVYPDRSRAAGAERRRIASCGGGPPAATAPSKSRPAPTPSPQPTRYPTISATPSKPSPAPAEVRTNLSQVGATPVRPTRSTSE
jgi:hypothetical protein